MSHQIVYKDLQVFKNFSQDGSSNQCSAPGPIAAESSFLRLLCWRYSWLLVVYSSCTMLEGSIVAYTYRLITVILKEVRWLKRRCTRANKVTNQSKSGSYGIYWTGVWATIHVHKVYSIQIIDARFWCRLLLAWPAHQNMRSREMDPYVKFGPWVTCRLFYQFQNHLEHYVTPSRKQSQLNMWQIGTFKHAAMISTLNRNISNWTTFERSEGFRSLIVWQG